ncbi:MAG: phenylacetate--CoA ligase family protein [Hyphomicrobiales bacterium]|nr:phenylacetate--CoA ligase family protein [Hyphomicrobiales bacterium]MCP5372971.1 phenylacetate--CoA ligase family protein [Hyphomicrobiales bacterium]
MAGAAARADFLPLGELAALRAANWRAQAEHVSRQSAFYHHHLGGRALDPRLEALADLPFTDKEMLRADQAAHPPFGSYLAAADRHVARVHRTSGTTGTAMNLALSERDADLTAVVGGRAQAAAGLGPGMRVVHCLNYQLWMGGLTDHMTLEATGATVVPFGVGATEKLVHTIRELGITAISCTPSYPAVLEQVLAERFPGLAPRDLGLKLGLFGGEAGLDDPAFRARLEGTWGFAARNANYGVTDVLCNFAGQCAATPDLHFMALDVLLPELIDPATGARRPWQEGENGELVLTHLAKDCQPLVRFRTGDLITLTATGPCACGRTAPRFRVVGRADDMVVVRGINVFPTMVAAAVHRTAGLGGEYRIVLRGPGPHDALPVEAERAAAGCGDDAAARLADLIKREIGVTATVRLLPHGTLPRTAGKTRRVVREDD